MSKQLDELKKRLSNLQKKRKANHQKYKDLAKQMTAAKLAAQQADDSSVSVAAKRRALDHLENMTKKLRRQELILTLNDKGIESLTEQIEDYESE